MLACYSQLEMKSKTRMSFLELKVIREDKAFTTSAYHKPTFSVVYKHFYSFLPSAYNFATVYTCF